MLDKVKRTIEKFNMAEKEESLLCCLSGGADSVALLLCLIKLGYNVKACHVNHQLRGEESLRDEEFCVRLCEKYGVELIVKRIDVKGFCAENSLSTEEGARLMRYRIFSECGCKKIATAHTLSDCLETTIFRLARGTGIDGLLGIPPVRENIIRPLIEVTRSEIEAFLMQEGQDFVTDSSNLTDDYSRNKIRHAVIPSLYALNNSLEKTYLNTLENLREDSRLLNSLADELYEKAFDGSGFDCKTLLDADNAITGRTLRRILSENNAEYNRERIGMVKELCKTGGKLTIGSRLYAVSKNGRLYFEREQEKSGDFSEIAEIGTEYLIFDKKIVLKTSRILQSDDNIHKNVTKNAADYDKIKGDIVIRNRRSGDRIRLAGRGFTSSVKKLLQSRFSAQERSRVIMLEDDEGLFFIEGFGFAERVKADNSAKTLLFCKIS